ncbi:hypothetical protein [Sphingomonas sp.]|uniref:hypothetical protein n=1 Tax=Sphingomonas sp. TaxID=28214 RepID=UPI003BAA2DF2
MADETITLVGGPAAGSKFAWSGGDLFKFVPPPALMIATERGLTRPKEPMLYRRSLNNSALFVFQP